MTVPIYVAIPVYNGGRTIRQTLTNVLQQTFQDFRVLVYDDGSTDRTAQILSQFVARDDRVTLLAGDQNLGRGAARNRLLEAAQDGIIAWQDADDTWNPTKLADQLSFFESFPDLGVDPTKAVMISTLNRKVNRKGQPVVTKCQPPAEYDTAYVLSEDYGQCPFQLQATFGLASVYLEAGGFDENLNWSEDLDIALRLLTNGFRIIPHVAERALATYNHSLAGAKGETVEKAQRILRDRHREFAAANGVDIDDLFAKRRVTYLFDIYLANKNFAKALAVTLDSLVEADEQKINRVSRNIIAVVRGMLQAQEEMWQSEARPYASQGGDEGRASRGDEDEAAADRRLRR